MLRKRSSVVVAVADIPAVFNLAQVLLRSGHHAASTE
jgi:hypothetical protein